MNEKNLVICDRELRYANSLGENISKHEDLAVKVYVCSSLGKVTQLMEDKKIHIFVVDEGYVYEERKQIDADQIFVLGRQKIEDLATEECYIRKYQCADEIIREIFEVYIEKTKDNLMRCVQKDQTRLMAVYSPIHRLGKTRFALAFGKECAKKKRVLYLNMEEYAGFEEEQQGLNLGDLLYYIKQGNTNVGVRLQTAVKKDEGLEYLLPIPVSLDLKEITGQEWEELLQELMENSAYQLIILDVGESVQGLFPILERCTRVYMPILEDEVSRRKLRQYDRNIEQLKKEKITRITYRFVMPENVEEYAKMRAKEEF